MKTRLLLLGLIFTSLFGRLEWGTDQRIFLFEAEWQVLLKLMSDPFAVAHPFVLLPLAGQALLLVALLMPLPPNWVINVAMGMLAVLLGFMAVIGIISLNWRILLSTMPFLTLCVLTVLHLRNDAKRVHSTLDN